MYTYRISETQKHCFFTRHNENLRPKKFHLNILSPLIHAIQSPQTDPIKKPHKLKHDKIHPLPNPRWSSSHAFSRYNPS